MGISISLTISEYGYSIPDNTSSVRSTVKYKKTSTTFNNNKKPGTTTLSTGATHSWTSSFPRGTTSGTLNTYIFKGVKHNADGSKSVSASAVFNSGVNSGTVRASAKAIDLTKIPRTSVLSLNKSTVPAGQTITATGTKYYSGFTDTIVLTFGSHSATLTSGTAYTIPESWLDAIPNGTSGTAKVTLTTRQGSTTIGSTSKTFTITTPTTVVPSITSVDDAEANSTVTTAFGNRYVQNLSQIQYTINATGIYSSTISSYSSTVQGTTYTTQTFTSPTITSSGSLNCSVSVTDSRGRSASTTKTVTVVPYSSPQIIGLNYIQCDADGTPNVNGNSMQVIIEGVISSVESQNSRTLTVEYKPTTSTSYTSVTVPTDDWHFTASTILNNITPFESYNLRITLADKVNSATIELTTNSPSVLTADPTNILLYINANEVYTLPRIGAGQNSWSENTASKLSSLVVDMKYASDFNMMIGLLRNGTYIYSYDGINFVDAISLGGNYLPIAMTTICGTVVGLLRNNTNNSFSVCWFNITYDTELTNGAQGSVPIPQPQIKAINGSATWNWITANENTVFLLGLGGEIASNSMSRNNMFANDWVISTDNTISANAPILNADFSATISTLCCLYDTMLGSYLMVTPTTAFK